MAERIQFDIVTPDRRVFADEVDEVVLPSVEGYMGVLPGHAPLLARLQVGEVSYRKGKTTGMFAISGGYAEVLRDRVSVLAETAERPGEIDVTRAQQARERAEQRLRSPGPDIDVERAQIALARALNRLKVSGKG